MVAEEEAATRVEEMMRHPKVGRSPKQPAQKDIDDHHPLHMEYKIVCPSCIAVDGCHVQHGRKVG